MTSINPYLHFNGQCREAMNFYKDCLGGELTLQPVEGSPMEQQCPVAIRHFILHAMLSNGSMVMLASDLAGREGHIKGNNISLALNCSSEEEIDTVFSKLLEGGAVVEGLKEQFWGARWGSLIDKYGITWMLNFNRSEPQKS